MMNNLYVRGRTWRTPWLLSILGLLMLLPGIGRAQTYLSENFNTAWVGTAESGAPANWTQSPVSIARGVAYTAPGASGTQYWINLQRTGGAWSPSGLSGGTPSIRPDGSALTDGDNIAFMQDFNASTGGRIGATGARLISPSVDLSGATNPVLALDFFYSSQTGNTPVSRIEATTDNGSTWHTVGYLLSPQSSTSAWDRYAFNIPAAFRVANIRFAVLQFCSMAHSEAIT